MNITLPFAGIVLLIGPSNSGKSTMIKKWIETGQLLPSEAVSSDNFRMMVGDTDFIDWRNRPKDESDSLASQYQAISGEAFLLMDQLIEARCRLNKLTMVDATHLHPEDRKKYVSLAKKHHLPALAIIMDIDEKTLLLRDEERDKPRGKRKVRQQVQVFRRERRFIKKEGFASVFTIKENDRAVLIRKRTNPLEIDAGEGIDIIGDIHGCYTELICLLERLGYQESAGLYLHPEGRKFLSLGDIMSRGPESLKTMQFFLRHISAGAAYMIDSNHGWKIARWLDGRKVTLSHGDERTAADFAQYEAENGKEAAARLKQDMKDMLLSVPSHYVITKNGIPSLVCAHAGIRDEYIGKQSHAISDFCRYGDTDGLNEHGKPIRKDWTAGRKGGIKIVWGHDPKQKPLFSGNTINIDQGAVFGGELTALRFPENELVSVKAETDHSGGDGNPLLEQRKNRLDPPRLASFIEGFSVQTILNGDIHVSKEIVLPVIDQLSHYAIPIEELIYIPPTMSPPPSPSALPDYLEHPREAIDYYRKNGVQRMVAEKKHMGSRGIILLFKNLEAGLSHIGREALGTAYTRTGRRFFSESIESEIMEELHRGLTEADYFLKHRTEYVVLDAEIMPWNLKAEELISSQYAHVAEQAILDRSVLLKKLSETEITTDWYKEYEDKLANALLFKDVFQKFCWDTREIRIAPFHVLAHSTGPLTDKAHTWHMEMNNAFAMMSDLFTETEYRIIDTVESEQNSINWWEEITSEGHEGIAIKPESFVPQISGKLLQPAIKVRGRKYLNIIYGMDYLESENLKRLKNRSTGKKQRLALKEFSLGIEGLIRFTNGESLERVHACVLATLAMEADPVDPRL